MDQSSIQDSEKDVQINWIPLESNPEVLNNYKEKLGVRTDLIFQDVWSLDSEMLQFIPQPVAALIFLFPITNQYEEYRQKRNKNIETKGQVVSKNLYFIKQTIGNACGTIGLFHALANTLEYSNLENGPFSKLLDLTKDKSPDERASVLAQDGTLASIHKESSLQGQTEAPDADQDVDLHFVCFVSKDGHLYEMDGRNDYPINHGESTDLLKDAAKIVQEYMEFASDNLNFTILALAPQPE